MASNLCSVTTNYSEIQNVVRLKLQIIALVINYRLKSFLSVGLCNNKT